MIFLKFNLFKLLILSTHFSTLLHLNLNFISVSCTVQIQELEFQFWMAHNPGFTIKCFHQVSNCINNIRSVIYPFFVSWPISWELLMWSTAVRTLWDIGWRCTYNIITKNTFQHEPWDPHFSHCSISTALWMQSSAIHPSAWPECQMFWRRDFPHQ